MSDLEKRVSELFSPKPWKHDIKKCEKPSHGAFGYCGKCNELFGKGYKNEGSFGCPVPDPIDITDLGKALEAYRTTPTLRRLPAQRQVRGDGGMGTEREEYLNWWIINEATAEQIWEICCLAKESEE
jgi:hypothetical protein